MSRPGLYDVGYGKPPDHSRFAKGKSGNPKGRPKKGKAIQSAQANTSACGLQLADKMLIEEAYRPLTIGEGGKAIQLPTIQLTIRAMWASAIKGNRHAQRMLIERMQQIEAADREAHLATEEALVNHKEAWTRAIAEARRAGREEPQPLPHPDDIIIDLENGAVHVCGPVTDDGKRAWDRWVNRRDEAQAEVSDYAERYRRARGTKNKAYWLSEWHREQKLFYRINDNLPRRYQKELEDRSYEDGASEPGSQKHLIWLDS